MFGLSAIASRIRNTCSAISERIQGLPSITRAQIGKELIQGLVNRDDPVIIEIGCNDGTHTLWLQDMFADPKIYCFEPDPRAIARFRKNVGNRKNIQLSELALCARDGPVKFFQSNGFLNDERTKRMPAGWDQSGSIRQPGKHRDVHPWVTFDSEIVVQGATLDAWSRSHGIDRIDFIWMDVQGAEIDVFKGAQAALSRTRFLYTEYNQQELYRGQWDLKKLLDYLVMFDVVVRYPEDVLLKNQHLSGDAM